MWIEEAFIETPESILSTNEKQDLLKSLNEIDVSTLKHRNKDEEESNKLSKITEKFQEVFDFFEYR